MRTYALSEPVNGEHTWQDGKRYAWLLGLLVPVLPFLAIGLHLATGWSVALWLGPIVVLVIVPVIDLFAGKDPTNPPDEIMEELEEDRYYRWVTYAYLPLQYAGLFAGMWYIATAGAPVIGNIGLAVTLGTVAGVAINTAHELGHKREDVERWPRRSRARPELLRPLLRRAQPWPPRARLHPGGPGLGGWARASTASGRAPSWAR